MDLAFTALRFTPLLPQGWLIALAVVCVLALLPAGLRRARGAVLRGIGFLLLLLWLAGPRLVQETRQPLPDIGVLLVDRSASMQVGSRTRLAETARAAIAAQAAKMPDLQLRTVIVPEQGNDGTQAFAALARALADIPPTRLAGVIAVTDGQISDLPARLPAALAQDPPVPLHALIAAHGEETDRRIRIITAPSYGLVGKPVTLTIAVDDLGTAHPGPPAQVTIRRDGEPPRVETVPIGQPFPIDIPLTRAGPTVIGLETDALPGEASLINNRAVVAINGVRDRLRVLLISGEPHQGERTWRRLLKADPGVDLVHFTILRSPDKDDPTPLDELALIAFPVQELFQDKIGTFDLIILDRFQNRSLLPDQYLQNIADYVRNGGALLLSAGPEFLGATSLAATAIGDVLPAHPAGDDAVVEGGFRPLITALGARHPVTAGLAGANDPADPQSKPAWGSWYRRIVPAADSHGQVLMSGPDGSPLLLLDRVGKGRVALLLSDQIWLWSRGHQGGGPQAELLRRIAHWTMQEPELEENALTLRALPGALAVDRRSLADAANTTVTLTDPNGQTRPLPLVPQGPGHATANLPAAIPGIWQANDGANTAYAAVDAANPKEFADLRATATLLSPLVQASGGGNAWLDDGKGGVDTPELRRIEPGRDAAGTGWIGLQRRHDYTVTGVAALTLLPGWLALPLLLGLILLAWRREST